MLPMYALGQVFAHRTKGPDRAKEYADDVEPPIGKTPDT